MKTENSYIYKKGVTPETRTTVSSRVKLFSSPYGLQGYHQVAVVSSFSESDSRSEQVIRGIGYGDQIAEIVPDVSQPISLSLTRTAINTSKIAQVFGYKGGIDGLVRALKHQKWPFDVRKDEVISHGCWFTSISTEASAEGTAISENAEIVVTDIFAEEAISNYVEGEDFGNDITRGQTGSSILVDNFTI